MHVDLAGHRFDRLTIEAFAGYRNGKRDWVCRCDCGGVTVVREAHLKSGRTRSCGCLTVEANRRRLTTHGRRRGPEYGCWHDMKTRCSNPKATGYENYGGRGIRVCERWMNSFEAFLSDVGPRPSLKHSLERIENDGHYEPGNVRWATRKEQANNRRPARCTLRWPGVRFWDKGSVAVRS